MSAGALPERASVSWRAPMTPERLSSYARSWTVTTAAQVVPMVAVAALLATLHPVAAVVALILLAHAWAIPELYANRGAKVVKPRARTGEDAERTALGLLGDLVGHEARELHARTGLVLERGALGVWLVGEAGALLVRGRRVHCWCVRVPEPSLPSSDRIAHLLLALREDEEGFATVANHAFAGARWRVRRRLPKGQRAALDAATRQSG
ncbi:hypothetical protein OJ997_11665 [Solirubrobacter phytolaccae]|uniref:Uncharacterized protein n=1 Tax=Solirubrobacter phytolaccae TaxID=1404360 RepID=A0A9X3N9K8_9ACTN|nr:hypothetical protein [Solirubrobacter phytolaccae]MDA0180954.1 hypothetical protein [Solirubrobacter phytolaccae]